MSEGFGARFFFTGEAGSVSGGIDSAGDCCLLCGGMDTILHYINATASFFQILNKSMGIGMFIYKKNTISNNKKRHDELKE